MTSWKVMPILNSFYLVANGKHRKQHIFKLEQEDGVIVGDAELKAYITNYYKSFFGPPKENNFSLVEDQKQDFICCVIVANQKHVEAHPRQRSTTREVDLLPVGRERRRKIQFTFSDYHKSSIFNLQIQNRMIESSN